MIVWGPRIRIGVFMENEKNLSSVLKDVLNVSIDYERGRPDNLGQ